MNSQLLLALLLFLVCCGLLRILYLIFTRIELKNLVRYWKKYDEDKIKEYCVDNDTYIKKVISVMADFKGGKCNTIAKPFDVIYTFRQDSDFYGSVVLDDNLEPRLVINCRKEPIDEDSFEFFTRVSMTLDELQGFMANEVFAERLEKKRKEDIINSFK